MRFYLQAKFSTGGDLIIPCECKSMYNITGLKVGGTC